MNLSSQTCATLARSTGRHLFWLPLLAMAWMSSGLAGVVIDQYNFAWVGNDSLAIGGNSEQMLAQTFTAGRDGVLDHVEIVIGCSAGTTGLITVELRSVLPDGRPSDVVLGSTARATGSFPVTAEIQDIGMPPVRIHSGTDYALILRGPTHNSCVTRRGAGSMFHSPGVGPAFYDARPNPPGWVPYTHMGMDAYLPFWIYVDIGGPSSPRFCDFHTADGTPNTWVPNDVPLCGCASDPGLVAHRCWFVTPDFVLWRTLPLNFDHPRVRAEWSLVPMVDELPGITVKEYDPNGQFASNTIHFKPGATPGKPNRQNAFYTGNAKQSEVMILIDGEPEPISIIFETLLEIPKDQ